MEKQFAKLTGIEHDRIITEETDYEFLHNLKLALLLALREQRILTPGTYRRAEETLLGQRRRTENK